MPLTALFTVMILRKSRNPISIFTQNTAKLTVLHKQTLSATITKHTHACKYASFYLNAYSALINIINRLLTRWHSLKRLHSCLPIVQCTVKNVFNENPHTLFLFLFLFYPSCYQNSRRSLQEGHFIQLSLSSYWRRQGGRKEAEWEGGGSCMCVRMRGGRERTTLHLRSCFFFLSFKQ